MPTIDYQIIEAQTTQITQEDASAVLDGLKKLCEDLKCEFVFAGGFSERDYSYHDIDISIIGAGDANNATCVCREVVKRLVNFSPDFNVDIYCEICGATMAWHRNDKWVYAYSPRTAYMHINWRAKRGAKGGLGLFEYCDLEAKVNDIDARLKTIEAKVMKP